MLIKCPECGREVSNEAIACPFCGYPIKKNTESDQPKQFEKYTEEEIRQFAKDAKDYASAANACIAIGLLMFLGGIIAIVLALVLNDIEGEIEIVLYALGAVFGDIGFIIMVAGGAVNSTKGNNRAKIVEEYKTRHPEFKEEK